MAPTKALAALFVCAMMLSAATALPLARGPLAMELSGRAHRGRMLLADWDGGVSTASILSENNAKAGIMNAVSSDQFGSTYGATQRGYLDADRTVYPDFSEYWPSAGNVAQPIGRH